VAQNEQLELLRAVAACEQQDQREQPAGNQVGERHKHGQPPGRERRRHPLPATDPWQPHRASRQSLCTVRARRAMARPVEVRSRHDVRRT
jgi:hypothetical protein